MHSPVEDKIKNPTHINSSLKSSKSLRIFSFLCLLIFFVITVSYVMVFNEGSIASPRQMIFGKYCSNNSEKEVNVTKVWNGTIYGNHDLGPKELWIHNQNKSYQQYFDMDFAKDCGIPYKHEELFNILKFWINLTAVHNIPWWLCYGSLIGAIRHKDMVPWDSDIDIAMPKQFEEFIRNISTPRKEISEKKVNIVARPGAHCPYNGPRMDCQGNMVTSQVDGCAFCGPFVRIFFTPSKRIDIYLIDIHFHQGKLQLADEGIFEYTSEMPHYPLDWFLPLRNCTFMGLTVQCPRKSETLLKNYYKTYQSYYKCVKGEWVLIKAK